MWSKKNIISVILLSFAAYGCQRGLNPNPEIVELHVMYDLFGKSTELKEWVSGDNLTHPDEFYLEVTIKNNGKISTGGGKIIVHAEYKTGRTMLHPDYDVLDYEKLYSSETAEWSQTNYHEVVIIEHIEPDQIVRVKTTPFRFREFYTSFSDKNLWPTRLKFDARILLKNGGQEVATSVQSVVLKTIPGD